MTPEAHAAAYLLHTLLLNGFSVPSVSEGMRRGLLTESDWTATVGMFERWV